METKIEDQTLELSEQNLLDDIMSRMPKKQEFFGVSQDELDDALAGLLGFDSLDELSLPEGHEIAFSQDQLSKDSTK